jgi:hypothetical protein
VSTNADCRCLTAKPTSTRWPPNGPQRCPRAAWMNCPADADGSTITRCRYHGPSGVKAETAAALSHAISEGWVAISGTTVVKGATKPEPHGVTAHGELLSMGSLTFRVKQTVGDHQPIPHPQ